MTKLKNIGLNALIYFCYFFGSCVLVMLVEAMVLSFLDKLMVLSYFVQCVIRIVIYSLGIPAVIGVLGYFEGYREASCTWDEVILGGLLASAIPHFLLAALFHFQPFASGAVRFVAGLMVAGSDIVLADLQRTTSEQLILVFAMYAVIYIATLTVCKYLGAKKRIMNRAELRRNEVPGASETNEASPASDNPFDY